MTVLEQVEAAIMAHKLEHGEPPTYVDAAPEVWEALKNVGVPTARSSGCLLLDTIPVFLENDSELCAPGSVRVAQYVDGAGSGEIDYTTMIEVDDGRSGGTDSSRVDSPSAGRD